MEYDEENVDVMALALRVLIGPVSTAILLLSFLAVRAYPITREKHAEIRAELVRRRAVNS